MSTIIPTSHLDLIEGPVCVTLVTLMPDNQPQASVVWCNYDGEHILVNSARGRQKDKNMRARPQVTILAIDPQNPYRFIEVRGKVAEITEEGALAHINTLAKLYTGADSFYGDVSEAEMVVQETRVLYKIKPLKVTVIS